MTQCLIRIRKAADGIEYDSEVPSTRIPVASLEIANAPRHDGIVMEMSLRAVDDGGTGPQGQQQAFGEVQMQVPLFSIVIACYNQQDFVRESVQSALSQQHPNKEVIVVDDASQDKTAEILGGFGTSIVFARMTTNQGACAARNFGASLATGKYLVFLDGDDVLTPWALDTYSRLIDAGSPAIILGRAAVCHKEVPHLTECELPREIRFVEYPCFLAKDRPWVYNTSALIVERAAFCATDGWSPEIFYQDIQDLLNKLGISGKTTLLLAPETVWYRFHTTNASYKVPAFIHGVRVLLAKEKAGLYPGGRQYRIERSAWFGGLIFYWMMKAFYCDLYRLGLELLLTKAWLIVLASIWRGAAWIVGRRPVQILSLEQACHDSESALTAVDRSLA